MADPKASRGYRNRNPGNIDWNERNKWQGQTGKEPTANGRFAQFDCHENGIRALAALLTTYSDRHQLRTVRGIINRWAPPLENVTAAYVLAVSRHMHNQPDDVLQLHSYAHMRPLVEAIIIHELGGNPYPATVIDEGLRRSGIVKPVPTIVAAAATQTGRGSLTVGLMATAAATGAPALAALGGLPQWTAVALIIAATIGGVAWVLSRRRDPA